MEQGLAGLGVVAELVGAVEGLGRPVQIAHPEPDLPDLVMGEAERVAQAESLQLLAGLARLQLGFGPLPAEHLQLGAMHAADPGIAADRLTTHPAFALVGPLAGTLEIADVPAGRDGVAEDVARDPQVELAGRRRGRRLLEQADALRQIALVHRASALEARRQELGVGVAVLPCDCDRAIHEREAVVHPVVHDGAHRGEHVQPGVHARLRQILEQSSGAAQPSPTHRRGETPEGLVTEDERHPGGVGRSVRRHVAGERSFQQVGRVVESAGPPGSLAHQQEVVGPQDGLALRRGERVERVRPGMPFDGLPAEIKRTGRRGFHPCLVVEQLSRIIRVHSKPASPHQERAPNGLGRMMR